MFALINCTTNLQVKLVCKSSFENLANREHVHGAFEHGTAISKLVVAETISNAAIEMSHRLAVFPLSVPVVVTTNTVNTIISAGHRSVNIFIQNVGAPIFKTLWENRGGGLEQQGQ